MTLAMLPWLLALDLGVAPPPASTAPSAAASTPVSQAPPTSPPPPSCDDSPWPQPAGPVSAAPVRVAEDGSFELLLTSLSPEAAAKAEPPPPGAYACLWIDPAAGYTYQTGLVTPLPESPSAPPRPPQSARFVRLGVQDCPGSDRAGACRRLTGVPELDDAPGRVPATLRLSGTSAPVPLMLYRTPSGWLLFLALVAGLAGSFLVTLLAPRVSSMRAKRARLRRLVVRRAGSEEDFMPLLNRTDALLGLLRRRLRSPFGLLRMLAFDEGPLDDRLDEASQLLELSEEKTAIWKASLSRDLPPSVQVQIADLLRQFDTDVFAMSLPVKATEGGAWYPETLKTARAKLGKADDEFRRDLAARLRVLLAPPAVAEPPAPVEQSARVSQGEEAAAPPKLSPSGTPQPDPNTPLAPRALEAQKLVRELRAGEVSRLERFRGQTDLAGAARVELREIDARLNVCRAADEYLTFLRSTQGQDLTEADLRELQTGLRDWRWKDLTGTIQGRPDLPALRCLRWQRENRQAHDRFLRLFAGTAGEYTLKIETDGPWTTHEPAAVTLALSTQADTFLWRQNLQVTWRVEPKAGAAAASMQFAVKGRTEKDGKPVRLFTCKSARTTAFTEDAGEVLLSVAKVEVRNPLGGDYQELPVGKVDAKTIQILKGADHWRSDLSLVQLARLFFTGTLAFTTGLLFLDSLWANAQGYAVYAQAFTWAFGVDLATVSVRNGFRKLQERPWVRSGT